jgi:hypothetical protein
VIVVPGLLLNPGILQTDPIIVFEAILLLININSVFFDAPLPLNVIWRTIISSGWSGYPPFKVHDPDAVRTVHVNTLVTYFFIVDI